MHERLISGPLLGQLQQLQVNILIIPIHASSAGAISSLYWRREQPGFPARYRYAPTDGAKGAEKVPPPLLGLPSKATPKGPRSYCAKPARPLNRGWSQSIYRCLSISQRVDFALVKEEKQLLMSLYQFPLLLLFIASHWESTWWISLK